jgi:hypothetical protein
MRYGDVGYSLITHKLTSGMCTTVIYFVLKSVTIKITLYLDVTEGSLVHRYQSFGRPCSCLF